MQEEKDAACRLRVDLVQFPLCGILSNINREYKAILGPGGCVLERYLWKITMNQTWMKLYDTSIKVRCKPALDLILQMRSGHSQAVARLFMTHSQNMTMKFPDCLKALGIEMEAKYVKRDMKQNTDLLAKLGVTFGTDGTVNYSKQEGLVSFEIPQIMKFSTVGKKSVRCVPLSVP